MDGNGCSIWKTLKCRRSFSKSSLQDPFYAASAPVGELQKMETLTVDDPSPIIEADGIGQYGRKENMRTFGEEVELKENVFAKVVSLAEKAELSIPGNYEITCHRLCPKILIAKFVWRDTRHQLLKQKRAVKETRVSVIDDLKPLVAKLTLDMRSRDDVWNDVSANDKIILIRL